MRLRLGTLLLALGIAACSAIQPQPPTAIPAVNVQAELSRLILVTVANPPEPVQTHAGSSLHGYEAMPLYAKSGSAHARLDAIAADYRLRPLAEWPIQSLTVECVVFELAAGDRRDALLAKLAKDPRVALAQPMQTFSTLSTGYNDPYIGLQRGFAQIDAADAQQWSRGEGIRVAVIDTGMDVSHVDLHGRIEGQRNFVDEDAQQFEADRHGTEIAGVIAADANNREGIVGVAPGVRMLAFKACWQLAAHADGAQCNSFTLAQALAIAIDAGVRVINLSLGGPADPLLTQLVGYAVKRGIVVVGAVPPNGRTDGFPVGVAGVIAVSALEQTVAGNVLHAPGSEVLTSLPGGHYDFVSGSSLAAAHVSGAAALLLQVNPRLDPAAVYDLLSRTSVSDGSGGGAINVCAALALLRPENACGARAVAGGSPAGDPMPLH